jgi:hypothetical protein
MKTTLKDIENSSRDYITINQAADVLGSCYLTMKKTIDNNPEKLGFPVIKVGNRVKIPKQPFLKIMRGE